jgi:hypothetical protein
MKRTKKWWACLTKTERQSLVYLERSENNSGGYGGYLPDDCYECGSCGIPCFGSGGGLCERCSKQLEFIIKKANHNCKCVVV